MTVQPPTGAVPVPTTDFVTVMPPTGHGTVTPAGAFVQATAPTDTPLSPIWPVASNEPNAIISQGPSRRTLTPLSSSIATQRMMHG